MQCKKCGTNLVYGNVCCEEKSTCIDCCNCDEHENGDCNDNCECGCNN